MLEVFRFECRYQLRSPLFVSICVTWFLLGFLIMGSESVSVGGVGTNLNLNASYTIVAVQYVLSVIGMFAAIAFVAGSITRDQEVRMAELLYATGVGEGSYLFGRFAGGSLFATLAVLVGLLGCLLGTLMPWLDPERLGAFTFAPYMYSIWAVVLPNMFVTCALFFSCAALTRSMMAAYLAALGFLILYVVIASNTDQESMGTLALFGPFGQVAFEELTRYWSVAERNYQLPRFAGTLLYNRLIWMGLGCVALLISWWRFKFDVRRPGAGKRERKATAVPVPRDFAATQHMGTSTSWRQFLSHLRMDIRGVTRSAPFYVLLGFGMFNVIGGFVGAMSSLYGTPAYPVTTIVAGVVGSNFSFVVLLVLIYYAGEVVHRERSYGVAQIVDATPFASGTAVAAKVVALWFVISAMFLVVILTGMLVQAVNGYTNFQPVLYLAEVLGVQGGSFYFWAVLAVFIQVLSPSKFVGMLALLVLFLASGVLDSFGYEHVLYSLSLPFAPYSDMNGYGHFLRPLFTVAAYLAGLGLLLGILAHLFYPRGIRNRAERWMDAAQRYTPAIRQTSVLAGVVTLALGGWIFYNTNVLNAYQTQDDLEALQADYERNYRADLDRPGPDVVQLDIALDIFPAQRRLESSGTARLLNDTAAAISEVPFTVAPELVINALTVEGGRQSFADEQLGYYRYELATPLAPGASVDVEWDFTWSHQGFKNSGSSTRLVHNGTFVNNGEIMPTIGYDKSRELQDNSVRREHDLPPVVRSAKLEEAPERRHRAVFAGRRSDFRAVVSTSADQTAIAPGYLEREWVEGERAYFEYVMDAPIWPFVSFVSARYSVREDVWQNPDPQGEDVELAVFYDPQHAYNVERMLESSKKSLTYFSREFSPYQYRQFRIMEFPGYDTFAQSFPNTIPFSERIGFIADLRDPAEIDYVFYVTAHELAHQWWAHQVLGTDVQGQTLIVETLAQYSALMVMEREYGANKMRRFLKYELDNYLSSRGSELVEELPLLRVEDQGYVHYRKGSLAMYALRDAIGEDKVNRALRSFIDKYAFNEEDYPTSVDLIAEFRAVADAQHQELITDLFEQIALFDLQVTHASVTPVDDEYEVSVTVVARKFTADGKGVETEKPLHYQLDLGVFGQPDAEQAELLGEVDLPAPLFLGKRTVVSGEQTFKLRVRERPVRVGIDPYNKMIDRNPDDNLRRIAFGG